MIHMNIHFYPWDGVYITRSGLKRRGTFVKKEQFNMNYVFVLRRFEMFRAHISLGHRHMPDCFQMFIFCYILIIV